MSTTQLPHLPVSTRDFAIETSLALNTVRRVPPSPPKQHKPLPPRPPRPEEEFAEEGFAARQVTPPLPVRSPRRGVDSPEPFAERGGRDGVPERSQHQTSTAPGQICGHGYAHGHAQNAAQPIALQTMHQLPTSFYAPKLAVSECAAEPVRRASTLDCKSWRTTWQRTRLALRVIVFLLLLVDVSMSTAMWENYRINKILAILTPIVIIYNLAEILLYVFRGQGLQNWILLIVDFVLACGMMSAGVYEEKKFSGYDGEDYVMAEQEEKLTATLAGILLAAGVMQGCVWVLGLVGLSVKIDE